MGSSQALLGAHEGHAVLPGDEQPRGEHGNPALEGPLPQIARELLFVGVRCVLEEVLDVAFDICAMVEQIGDEFVVRFRLQGGEHALGIPIARVELGRLAQVVLRNVELRLGVLFGRCERRTVVDDLRCLGYQVKRALTIGVDERRGVVLERLGGTIDVQGVLEELNASRSILARMRRRQSSWMGSNAMGLSFPVDWWRGPGRS